MAGAFLVYIFTVEAFFAGVAAVAFFWELLARANFIFAFILALRSATPLSFLTSAFAGVFSLISAFGFWARACDFAGAAAGLADTGFLA